MLLQRLRTEWLIIIIIDENVSLLKEILFLIVYILAEYTYNETVILLLFKIALYKFNNFKPLTCGLNVTWNHNDFKPKSTFRSLGNYSLYVISKCVVRFEEFSNEIFVSFEKFLWKIRNIEMNDMHKNREFKCKERSYRI